ncbi:MAG: DUF465 domain-containing protein [Pseudomonadota bacterium]
MTDDQNTPDSEPIRIPINKMRLRVIESDSENEPGGEQIGSSTTDVDEPVANDEVLLRKLTALEQDHADLAAAIEALQAHRASDPLTIARLKKKKLQIKDLIYKIRERITPDIIA